MVAALMDKVKKIASQDGAVLVAKQRRNDQRLVAHAFHQNYVFHRTSQICEERK